MVSFSASDFDSEMIREWEQKEYCYCLFVARSSNHFIRKGDLLLYLYLSITCESPTFSRTIGFLTYPVVFSQLSSDLSVLNILTTIHFWHLHRC